MRDRTGVWIGGLSAFAVIVGAFGPWLRGTVALLGSMTNHGTDNPDGKIILGVGLTAGALVLTMLMRATNVAVPIAATGAFTLAIIAGIVDYGALQDRIDQAHAESMVAIASIGWGIYAVMIGGAVGAVMMLVESVSMYQSRPHAAAPVPQTVPRVDSPADDDRILTVIGYGLAAFVVLVALGMVLTRL
jgi:hypothetical protein